MDSKQRIELSRRTITGWEAVGTSGRPEDTLRLIQQELAALRAIAEQHPVRAGEIDGLAQRYGQLANRIRLGMN